MKNKYVVIINNNMVIECEEGELTGVVNTTTKYMTIRTMDITIKQNETD